jgi:hypothetical protein
MSHQHGLSNNGTETTGFTEPDDSDDRVQKESENVVHSRMVSNGRSSRIQDLWGIRLPRYVGIPDKCCFSTPALSTSSQDAPKRGAPVSSFLLLGGCTAWDTHGEGIFARPRYSYRKASTGCSFDAAAEG